MSWRNVYFVAYDCFEWEQQVGNPKHPYGASRTDPGFIQIFHPYTSRNFYISQKVLNLRPLKRFSFQTKQYLKSDIHVGSASDQHIHHKFDMGGSTLVPNDPNHLNQNAPKTASGVESRCQILHFSLPPLRKNYARYGQNVCVNFSSSANDQTSDIGRPLFLARRCAGYESVGLMVKKKRTCNVRCKT